MTETNALRALGIDLSNGPRRLILAHLVGRLAAGLATQARTYEAAAEQAHDALRQALEALARAKQAEAADLAPLVRALALSIPSPPTPPSPDSPPSWGVILGEAFQGERTLEGAARELAGLVLDPATTAQGARLASRAARDGATVRGLYLRYS